MEKSNPPTPTSNKAAFAETTARPLMALQMEDVADLHTVLRGYYLRQIKSLKKRKDRKLARRLLEDHLILPKSRQRTSKDAAYIKEMLGMESDLLAKLEDSRLIRRMHKTGTNPIYEVSHDTLVEPILSEKRSREAIAQFIRKTWKYAALFLLLWFLFGMWLEHSLEVIPDAPRQARTEDIILEEKNLPQQNAFTVYLPPIAIPRGLQPGDSLAVQVPLRLISLPGPPRKLSRALAPDIADTIGIKLTSPIEVAMDTDSLDVVYQPFSDIVALAYAGGDLSDKAANRIYGRLSGSLRISKGGIAQPGIQSSKGAGAADAPMGSPSSYVPTNLRPPLEINLGDTIVRARSSTRSVPVRINLQLTDLFADEVDKENVRSTIGDRPVRLSYTVQVRPTPTPPPPPKPELPELRGIEVQYSDGTRKFIPGAEPVGTAGSEILHTVAKGETLYSIAKQYGVTGPDGKISVVPIKERNGLEGNAIKVGQQLRIPTR